MSNTGWTWQHVRHECDIPTYLALCKWWRDVPPPAQQLRRIAQFIGLPEPDGSASSPATGTSGSAHRRTSAPSSPNEVLAAAAQAGIPAFEGRPNDPMLDFIPPAPPAEPTP